MYFANIWFGTSIGHLMDQKFLNEPMSWEKARSILSHLWIPVIIVGTAGTAGMIRRLRANLLDELQKQYVMTARAKGLHPFRTLVKYPLRMALNFFVSDIGSILPSIISGAEITAIVLSLETTGPMLIKALQSQDMYLAGSFLMFLAFLTVIGVLISDIALAFLDPRIRLQAGAPSDGAASSARRALAALCLDGAVRSDVDRGDDRRAGENPSCIANAVDVVEIQAAQGGSGIRHIFCSLLYGMIIIAEFLAPYNLHTRNVDFHPFAATAGAFVP